MRRSGAFRPNEWRKAVVCALAAIVAFPTATAYSDITSLLSGADAAHGRWKAHLTAAPSGSVQSATMAFTDPILTGSTDNSAAVDLADGRRVALSGDIGAPAETPDEARVTRSQKKSRILSVAPVKPPEAFTAGSVIDQSTSLLSPAIEKSDEMAFVKPRISGDEVKIATAFYRRVDPAPPAGMPKMLASLVTNPSADILATAYADDTPDYARRSPFASILRESDRQGRFIPPMPTGDPNHAWVATALPADAFSQAQQRCLAAGVYFEARGESVKGQAAVAQVILNRVRNPTYPDSICGVVYQNKTWRNRCQFSFACDGIRDRVRSPTHWTTAKDVALAATAGKIWLSEVGASTHYHASYVHPRWARAMKEVDRIGLHVFYQTYGGGWK